MPDSHGLAPDTGRAFPTQTARRATRADIPSLVRLVNAAYRVEDFFVDGDRTNAADIETRMASSTAAFLVIAGQRDGELRGSVYVDVRGDRGYFGMLAVDPARQKEGLGRALVLAAEAHCRAAGCRFLDLDVVNLRQELPAFYRNLGYAPFATAPFPKGEKLRREAHLVLMTKPLVEL
jgi:ribosomal protein S18 acetylase RimI-like enzyme